MDKIIWKGRTCLNQENLEPAIELVGTLNNKSVSMIIDQAEIDEYKILTGKNLIDEKKRLLERDLIR
jgi:hypothetical protein